MSRLSYRGAFGLSKNPTPVAVASRSFSRHPVLRAELEVRYETVTFNDTGLILEGSALISFLQGHSRAIIGLEKLGGKILDKLPELKVVSKYGVGVDALDLAAMSVRGVKLGWTGGVNSRSVSELVVSFAIALLRHLPVAYQEVRNGIWRQTIGNNLSGCTMGIIGCGHVGKDLVRLLKAFECNILAHDIINFPEFYALNDITPVGLEKLLRCSDIVTVHLPLDKGTRCILDADRLRMMKRGGILINTARGGLVDEGEVKEMLQDGHLAGAAFDVFEQEPPRDSELVNLPNFLATPHMGGSSEESTLAMGRAAIGGLDNAGDPLLAAS